MSKGKRFSITDGVVSYAVTDDKVGKIDLNKAVPGFDKQPKVLQAAFIFALKTALRNATAGKMGNAAEQEEAFQAVAKRCAAIESGEWAAGREGRSGESTVSILARAVAEVMGTDVQAAVAFLDAEVDKALTEAGIDPEASEDDLSEEEKVAKRKEVAKVKKGISDDPAILPVMARIRREDAEKREKAASESAAGKTSRFAK